MFSPLNPALRLGRLVPPTLRGIVFDVSYIGDFSFLFLGSFFDVAYEDGWYPMRTTNLDVRKDAGGIGDR